MRTTAKVFAFDTNPVALDACREMGRINGVEINTGGFCDKATLLSLELGSRALIICDCEGYEAELIDDELSERLRKHDFLIETHDIVHFEITKNILDTLSQTHDCQLFESKEDIIKAYTYHFSELKGFDLEARRLILAEQRPQKMYWVFAKARQNES